MTSGLRRTREFTVECNRSSNRVHLLTEEESRASQRPVYDAKYSYGRLVQLCIVVLVVITTSGRSVGSVSSQSGDGLASLALELTKTTLYSDNYYVRIWCLR